MQQQQQHHTLIPSHSTSPSLSSSRLSHSSLHIGVSCLPSSDALSSRSSSSNSSLSHSTPHSISNELYEQQESALAILQLSQQLQKSAIDGEEAMTESEIPPASHPYADKYPHPSYTAQQVVEFQLGAMQQNDSPYADAGAEIAFRFSSPLNQIFMAPVQRFARMLHTPLYEILLNFDSVKCTPANAVGNKFQVCVSKRGVSRNFLWNLSKQTSAQHNACWMTDSVVLLQD